MQFEYPYNWVALLGFNDFANNDFAKNVFPAHCLGSQLPNTFGKIIIGKIIDTM